MPLVKQMRPRMADCEIEIMNSIFETNRPKSVLEWGVGGSTVYWPAKYDFITRWLGIEQRPEYAEWYRAHVPSNVEVRLREPVYEQYIAPLLESEERFDLILVDGALRIDCLKAAHELLAEHGVVVLHDAGRTCYWPGWVTWSNREWLYRGELPDPKEGGYMHRGLVVLWQDADVRQKGWKRNYAP